MDQVGDLGRQLLGGDGRERGREPANGGPGREHMLGAAEAAAAWEKQMQNVGPAPPGLGPTAEGINEVAALKLKLEAAKARARGSERRTEKDRVKESLFEKARSRQELKRDRRPERAEHGGKRMRRDESHDGDATSSSEDESRGVFRDAPSLQMRSFQQTARAFPGRLMQTGLVSMQKYLDPLTGQRGGSAEDVTSPRVVRYLTTVLQVSHQKGQQALGLRNERELRTLAEALDLLLEGQLPELGDLLTQRFKSVETAALESNWDLAKHFELIPAPGVSAVSDSERAIAATLKLREAKLYRLVDEKTNRKGGQSS